MKKIPKTENSPVLRTDFDDEAGWNTICGEILQPSEEGFQAYVEFIDDRAFQNLNDEQLLNLIPECFGHWFIIVVDHASIASSDHPILIVDLDESPGRSFRAIPSQIQGIENNLSIANMGFDEFADAVDANGVFRGFD